MQTAASARSVALAFIALCLGDHSYAQTSTTALKICVESKIARVRAGGEATGIALSDAERLVYEIAHKMTRISSPNFSNSLSLVPCNAADTVYAWYPQDGPNPQSVDLNRNWIVFNPTWVRQVIGSDRNQAISLFGHELGHHINGHFTWAKYTSRLIQETEADGFAGCAIAVMEGDWSALENLLTRLRDDFPTERYPDRKSSLASAQEGFIRCGGKFPEPAPKPAPVESSPSPLLPEELLPYHPPVEDSSIYRGHDIVYLRKSADRGRIEQVLRAEKIPFRVVTGETREASNTLTCTADTDIRVVKNIMKALLTNNININYVENNPYHAEKRKRISIESFYGSNDPLAMPITEDQVDKLQDCESIFPLSRSAGNKFRGIIRIENKCSRTATISIRYTNLDGTTRIEGPWPLPPNKNSTFRSPAEEKTLASTQEAISVNLKFSAGFQTKFAPNTARTNYKFQETVLPFYTLKAAVGTRYLDYEVECQLPPAFD